MKNNIDFYQHYANSDQHPKFKMLRVQYGWSGEGKFWALNNRIAQSDNCCLDISKKYTKAAIASDIDLNLKEFDEFVSYLLDDCELLTLCEPGVITTDIIQENFNRVASNREKARERKQRWFEKVRRENAELDESSGDQNNKGKSKGKSKSKDKGKVKGGVGGKKKAFTPPTIEDVITFFHQNSKNIETAEKAFYYYQDANWHDASGKPVLNWKQKMRGNWFDEKKNQVFKPLNNSRMDHNKNECLKFVQGAGNEE